MPPQLLNDGARRTARSQRLSVSPALGAAARRARARARPRVQRSPMSSIVPDTWQLPIRFKLRRAKFAAHTCLSPRPHPLQMSKYAALALASIFCAAAVGPSQAAKAVQAVKAESHVAAFAAIKETNFADGNSSAIHEGRMLNQYYPTTCTSRVDALGNSGSYTVSAQGTYTLTFTTSNKFSVGAYTTDGSAVSVQVSDTSTGSSQYYSAVSSLPDSYTCYYSGSATTIHACPALRTTVTFTCENMVSNCVIYYGVDASSTCSSSPSSPSPSSSSPSPSSSYLCPSSTPVNCNDGYCCGYGYRCTGSSVSLVGSPATAVKPVALLALMAMAATAVLA
jgi:hypothetical protein